MSLRPVQAFVTALADAVVSMGGYFLLAVLVAAVIKTFKLDKRIRHALEGAGGWSIPLAVITGLVSPLCSCGVLPVVASLMAAGVPTAPVMALLITSPVMSPDAFVLTLGVLGPGFAWGKLAGAAAMGLVLGGLVQVAERRGWLPREPWRAAVAAVKHHCVDPEDRADPRRGLTVTIPRWRYFLLMLKDMGWMIGRFLVLAFVLEALMVALVPAGAVRFLVGRPSVVSVFLATAVGLPLPLQQVAVVPILKGLLDMGASRGAAMALLMTGPVTSVPAVVFLSGMVDRRLLWGYLAVGLGCSLAMGLLFVV